MQATYLGGAASPKQFPAEDLPEVAFLGRSNVGKSSLLNCLLEGRQLARISSRPGCTRLIHFYRVGGRFHFVDLPGYGYARVSRDEQLLWKRTIEAYLLERKSLALSILALDARRGWMEPDWELKQWLECHQRHCLVVATKVDKLRSQTEKSRGLAAIGQRCPEGGPVPFSAVTGQGVREIWQAIMNFQNRR